MDGRLFLKSCLSSSVFIQKEAKKEPKNRKKPNEIFSSQTKSKEAKIEKFGSFNAKLATLFQKLKNPYFFLISNNLVPRACRHARGTILYFEQLGYSSWEICYRYADKLLAHVIFYKNSKI